jgi:hypothetical protein
MIYGEDLTCFDENVNPIHINAPPGNTGRLIQTPAFLKLKASEGHHKDKIWGMAPLGTVICRHGHPTYDEDEDVDEENALILGPETSIFQARFEGGKFVRTEAGLTGIGLESMFEGLRLNPGPEPDDGQMELE